MLLRRIEPRFFGPKVCSIVSESIRELKFSAINLQACCGSAYQFLIHVLKFCFMMVIFCCTYRTPRSVVKHPVVHRPNRKKAGNRGRYHVGPLLMMFTIYMFFLLVLSHDVLLEPGFHNLCLSLSLSLSISKLFTNSLMNSQYPQVVTVS